MNQWLKKFAKAVLFYSGLLALYRFVFCRNSALILVYHRIAPADQISTAEAGFNVTPTTFEKQMRFLAHRYRVLPLVELISVLTAGRRFRRRTIVLTFDDGRRDNLDVAFPILRKFALPATFFVVTRSMDAPDKNHFGWSDAQILVRNGMAIGSHTHSHKRLATCSREELLKELGISRARISSEIGGDFFPFAYPYGDMNQLVRDEVARSNYHCAVSTKAGFVSSEADLFALPRVHIDEQSTATLPLFAARLAWLPRQSSDT